MRHEAVVGRLHRKLADCRESLVDSRGRQQRCFKVRSIGVDGGALVNPSIASTPHQRKKSSSPCPHARLLSDEGRVPSTWALIRSSAAARGVRIAPLITTVLSVGL